MQNLRELDIVRKQPYGRHARHRQPQTTPREGREARTADKGMTGPGKFEDALKKDSESLQLKYPRDSVCEERTARFLGPLPRMYLSPRQ